MGLAIWQPHEDIQVDIITTEGEFGHYGRETRERQRVRRIVTAITTLESIRVR